MKLRHLGALEWWLTHLPEQDNRDNFQIQTLKEIPTTLPTIAS